MLWKSDFDAALMIPNKSKLEEFLKLYKLVFELADPEKEFLRDFKDTEVCNMKYLEILQIALLNIIQY